MPHFSEAVISMALVIISLTVIIVTFIVVKSRRGSPLTLQVKGFGVEFTLSPSGDRQTGNIKQNEQNDIASS